MEEVYTQVFMFRGIERLMIVVGGLIFGYLGYRLFLYGIDQGNGKLETESKFFKLTFSGSGPGLFFMAFGALILINGVYSTAFGTRESELNDSISAIASRDQEHPSAQSQPTRILTETLKFSGEGSACDVIQLSAHDDQPQAALFAYQNGLEQSLAGAEIGELAGILEASIDDDAKLKEILFAIEEVICKMEN